MTAENHPPGCPHCQAVLAELERCRPLSETPLRWGRSPFWGKAIGLARDAADHPAFQPAGCQCSCHLPWRMLTGIAA